MNIHFVVLRNRKDLLQRILSATASVRYRVGKGDRLFVYTNLCLSSFDLSRLRDDLECELYLQPLASDEGIALSNLPDIVTAHAREYSCDANILIDNDGICKHSRVVIIPAYSSNFRG